MVFVEGGDAPRYKHLTLEAAEEEAKRLARMTRKKVYVLCTLKSFEIKEFEVQDCCPFNFDSLPF